MHLHLVRAVLLCDVIPPLLATANALARSALTGA